MLEGGCLCGAVRYTSTGAALFSVVCHCRDCQKASGTGGVPVMAVPKSTFQVSGTAKRAVIRGGSGRQAIRHFCPECGSLLFGTPEVVPDVVTIYVGSLDDPGVFTPQEVIFTRDRASWAKLAVDVPEHEAAPAR
jgi:hypothetical protein